MCLPITMNITFINFNGDSFLHYLHKSILINIPVLIWVGIDHSSLTFFIGIPLFICSSICLSIIHSHQPVNSPSIYSLCSFAPVPILSIIVLDLKFSDLTTGLHKSFAIGLRQSSFYPMVKLVRLKEKFSHLHLPTLCPGFSNFYHHHHHHHVM